MSTPARSTLPRRAAGCRSSRRPPRREAAPGREAGAIEHVAEELVDLPAHALEVREGSCSRDIRDRGNKPAGIRAGRRRPRWRCPPGRRSRQGLLTGPEVSSSSEMCVSTSRSAPAPRPCSPASRGSGGRASPVRSGRGRVASISSRSARARSRSARRSGRVGAEHQAAAAVRGLDADRERLGEVRAPCGSGSGAARPRGVELASYSSSAKAFSIRSSLPQAPTTRRKVSPRPRRRDQPRARRVVGAGPAVHRHGLLARRVGERVGVRDQVEEVVGVQVRDDDSVDGA